MQVVMLDGGGTKRRAMQLRPGALTWQLVMSGSMLAPRPEHSADTRSSEQMTKSGSYCTGIGWPACGYSTEQT